MHKQRGAVSIFVVVFSALFVTIITVSFVSLMIRAQQQASNADLSNSAYDSALAGVEDAKRVLLKYRQCLQNSSAAGCAQLIGIFNSPDCNMVRHALGNTDDGETLIKSEVESTNGNSKALDQAYTCVEIDYTAAEKELQLKDGVSTLVPIDSNGQPFNAITISWFMRTTESPAFTLPNVSNPGTDLPARNTWGIGAPPILRTQIVQHAGTFNSADFDSDQADKANTKTGFLYPVGGAAGSETSISAGGFDNRPAANPGTKSLLPVSCSSIRFTNNGQYACIATIQLPEPIGTGGRSLYLELEPLYNDTKVKIELKSGSDLVEMVAPTVDSTGRANDLFRRVKVGISFTGEYPRSGFDINGNLCKNFAVTDTEFIQSPGTCDVNNP